MSDPREPGRGNMQEKPPDELLVIKSHVLLSALVLVVLVGEGCLLGCHVYNPAVGNGSPVGVAPQIPEHPLRTIEGLLAVDNPILTHDGIQKGIELLLFEHDVP